MVVHPDVAVASAVTPEFVALLPKVELHVHLEGSLTPDTVVRFAQRNRITLPAATPQDLSTHYTFSSLPEFLRVYLMCAGTLRTPLDFAEATTAFLEYEASQNVRYVEVFVAPKLHVANGVNIDELLTAILTAGQEAQRRLGVRMGLIVDMGRLFGPEPSPPLARAAVRHRDEGVVGIGLGGDERSGPHRLWRESFAIARDGGLHLTAHGGEVCGPESVWGAVLDLGIERLGHAVAAVEDPALVAYLVEKKIGLELCPQSNVQIGAARDLTSHPFEAFRRAGGCVTINSDDPAIFGNPLNAEYLAVAQANGLSPHELCRVALNAVDVSFLPPIEKESLRAAMVSEMNRALATIGWPPLTNAE
jgi:adenosine deaminase